MLTWAVSIVIVSLVHPLGFDPKGASDEERMEAEPAYAYTDHYRYDTHLECSKAAGKLSVLFMKKQKFHIDEKATMERIMHHVDGVVLVRPKWRIEIFCSEVPTKDI